MFGNGKALLHKYADISVDTVTNNYHVVVFGKRTQDNVDCCFTVIHRHYYRFAVAEVVHIIRNKPTIDFAFVLLDNKVAALDFG